MDINDLQKTINEVNEDYSGLSIYEIGNILIHPLKEKCPIKIQEYITDETLNQIPFFRLCEEYLKLLNQEQEIKLTPLGSLPKKVVVELYEHKIITHSEIELGISKLSKEDDSTSIVTVKHICNMAGLTKKRDNKISLTKKGEKLLKNRAKLFKLILKTFSIKFNWAFHDSYTKESIAQHGHLYTIYLLLKYGDQEKRRKESFYAAKYLISFPSEIDAFNLPIEEAYFMFARCFITRTFKRFTDWFGFTVPDKEILYNFDKDLIITDIVSKVYQYIPQKSSII